MYIGFASPELSSAAISDYLTRVVQPLLATVDGVASADILGGQTFAMRLWLDPARMAARGISASDVAAAIRANNFQSAPGQAKGYFTITNVNANTGLADVEQFNKMVVKAKDGAVVRMEDIASVDLDAQSWTSSIAMNGQHAVFIGVQATPTGNPLSLVAGIRALLPEIERNLPPSVKMQVAYDSTKFIQASIDEVKSTLVAAVVIVIGVIFLFLGSLRAVLIPVVTIPLSLVGAGIIMAALGFSLNLLTLLAMVLAIGLVVDDAIVVLENVYRHIEEGRTPAQAALIGAREIAGPVISMTLTLAAVYAPIGFLGGVTGALFREFAFTLAGAVIISGVVAVTLSPMMCSLLLSREMLHGRFVHLIDRVFSRLTEWYGRKLERSLDYRPVTALFAAAVFASLVFMYMQHKSRTRPRRGSGSPFRADQGAAILQSRLPGGLYRQARPGLQLVPRNRFALHRQWQVRAQSRHCRRDPQTLGRALAFGAATKAADAAEGVGRRRDERLCLLAAATARIDRRTAGANGDLFDRRLQRDLLGDGQNQGCGAQERAVHGHRQRSRFQSADNPGQGRPLEGQRARADHAVDRRYIGAAGRRELRQPVQSRRPVLRGDSASAAGRPPDTGNIDALLRHHASGQPVPLSNLVTLEMDTQPNALTQYNQLNSATFQAVPMPGVTMGQAVDFLEQQTQEPACRLQPRLPLRHAPIRPGRQSADDHLHLCADRDLSRAGGAVRKPARSAGDPRQRADVDVRRVDAAVLRLGDNEHLYPGRARDLDRADQQARDFDGRVRQYAAGARKPRPPARDRAAPRGSGCGRY